MWQVVGSRWLGKCFGRWGVGDGRSCLGNVDMIFSQVFFEGSSMGRCFG